MSSCPALSAVVPPSRASGRRVISTAELRPLWQAALKNGHTHFTAFLAAFRSCPLRSVFTKDLIFREMIASLCVEPLQQQPNFAALLEYMAEEDIGELARLVGRLAVFDFSRKDMPCSGMSFERLFREIVGEATNKILVNRLTGASCSHLADKLADCLGKHDPITA